MTDVAKLSTFGAGSPEEVGVVYKIPVSDLKPHPLNPYAELLSRKKEMYPEYRKLRSEMKELLTVKANVDRLLNMDTQPEREEQRDKPR